MTKRDNQSEARIEPEETESPNEESSLSLSRRSYLRLAGAAAAVGGVSATAPAMAALAAASYRGYSFSNVVDMVADAGCDNDGSTDCSDEIENYAADDTLLVFPPGDYRIANKVTLDGYTKVGLYGIGDVTFVWDSGFNRNKDFELNNTTHFYYEGIDWDITADTCPGMFVMADQSFHLENIEIIGRGNGDANALNPFITNSDGLGLIRNFVAKTGSDWNTDGRVGVLVSRNKDGTARNYGTIRLEDCHLEEFENNGIYAGGSKGPVQVRGGVFRNNNRAGVRLAGPDSWIENAFIEADLSKARPGSNATTTSNPVNLRGIWWNSYFGKTGGEVRGCDIRVAGGTNSQGAIAFRDSGGAMTLKDTRIEVHVNETPALWAQPPDKNLVSSPYHVQGDNIQITHTGDGDQSAGDRYDNAVYLNDRDNSDFTNCSIEALGAEMNGFTFKDSGTCSVSDTAFDVTDSRIIEKNTTVNRTNLSGNAEPDPVANVMRNGVEFSGGHSSDWMNFDVSVVRALQPTANVESGDTTNSDNANGRARGGGTDTFEFAGDLDTLHLDLAQELNVDVDRDAGTIDVTTSSDSPVHDYTITVNGQIFKGSSADSSDSLNAAENEVSGSAGSGGSDDYTYTGQLEEIDINNGDARATVTREHILTIEDVEDGTNADYTFTVSGDLYQTDDYGATNDSSDTVSGGTADGAVGGGGRDSYRFTGEITGFSATNPVNTYVDGHEVVTASLGHDKVVVDGTADEQNYRFQVIEGVGRDTGNHDTVHEREVEGTVWSCCTDNYRYRNGVLVTALEDNGANVSYSDL